MYPLTWVPAAAVSPAGSAGAINLYLRHDCMPCLDLALSALSGCLGWVPTLSPTAAVPRCGLGGATGPRLHVIPLSQQLTLRALIARVAGGSLSPLRARLSFPGTPSPLVGIPEVLPPWGNSSTLGVLMP